MTKVDYTIAINFSYRQQASVCKFNGFTFIRYGKGSHEIWGNKGGVQIVLAPNGRGTTFAATARQHKFEFYDARGKKVY